MVFLDLEGSFEGDSDDFVAKQLENTDLRLLKKEISFYDPRIHLERTYDPTQRVANALFFTQKEAVCPVGVRVNARLNEGGSGIYDQIDPNLELRIITMGLEDFGSTILDYLGPFAVLIDNTLDENSRNKLGELAKRDEYGGIPLIGYGFDRRPVLTKFGWSFDKGEELGTNYISPTKAQLVENWPGKSLPQVEYVENGYFNFEIPSSAQVFLQRLFYNQKRE